MGNLIASVETINTKGEVWYRTEFVYTNNRVAEKTEYLIRATGSFPHLRTKLYYNTEGNIIRKELFDYIKDNWKKAEEIIITAYDNKLNTTQHFENYPYLPLNLFSVNNPISENYVNDMGPVNASVVHEYIYDAGGRPVRRKTTYKYMGFPDTFSEGTFHY